MSSIEGNVKNVENQLNSLSTQLATIVKENKQKGRIFYTKSNRNPNQNNVSECSDMSTRGLLFQ